MSENREHGCCEPHKRDIFPIRSRTFIFFCLLRLLAKNAYLLQAFLATSSFKLLSRESKGEIEREMEREIEREWGSPVYFQALSTCHIQFILSNFKLFFLVFIPFFRPFSCYFLVGRFIFSSLFHSARCKRQSAIFPGLFIFGFRVL